jgi:hypothetical protein
MEYIKVPYVRLRGKKYGGDLSPEEEKSIVRFYVNGADQLSSEAYGGTFQELYKIYKNGEDPIKDAFNAITHPILNPEKIFQIHDAISTIAKKYGYDMPDQKKLISISLDTFKKLSTPNSYFISRGGDEYILIITDNNSTLTYIVLPIDKELEIPVDVDKNGNILIPKDAYDEDLDVF